jgi:7,8-dihydropterin-6-yl-methyl-4-(beta-D-ribofuranosyl)aminobenzene 5'-phosphate synthase
MATTLREIDSVEITVIIDNEVDPLSQYTNEGLEVSGRMQDIAMTSPHPAPDRGGAVAELRLDNLCCGAHGLSYMIVGGHLLDYAMSVRN